MRFETSELTLHGIYYEGRYPQDAACLHALQEEYRISGKQGQTIVIVFSTERVDDAATCFRGNLWLAGAEALRRISEHWMSADTTLWWWVEIVQ